MSPRLAFHVGPHKTGSTSVQEALDAHRDRLVAGGVLYPASLPGADHATSHAALTRLLATGQEAAFLDWVADAMRDAGRQGCDTVLVSSEGFSSPRSWPSLRRIVRRLRRRTECRFVYVARDLQAVTYSMMVQRLHNQAGFLHPLNHDLRAWAREFACLKDREERFFRRLGATVLGLEAIPRNELAARVLAAACGRDFPDIPTGDVGRSAAKFAGTPKGLLSYALRVMEVIAHGGAMASTHTHLAAAALIRACELDPDGFAALQRDFETAARRQIAAGIADHRRAGWWSDASDRLRRASRILFPSLS
ncbi:MAG: hypothetical protein ACKOC8_01445 [Pirellulales bacterium]